VEFINQNFHKLGMFYQFNTSLLNINIFKYNIFPPENIIDELKAVVKGMPFEKEMRDIKTNNGRLISLTAKGSPIYEDDSISGGMLIIENLQFYSEIADESQIKLTDDYINKGDIFLIVTDTRGDIKYSAGKEIQGAHLLRKEITGRNISDIFNSPIKQKILGLFNSAVQYGKLQFFQIDFMLDETTKKFDCTIEPVIGENGFVQILYFIFKESPLPPEEIQSMLDRLRKLEYYQEVSRRNDTGLILIRENGDIIDWDEQFENLSGIERAEARILVHEYFTSLDSDEFSRIIRQLDFSNSCELTTYLETRTTGRLPVNLNFYKSKESKADIIVLCSQIKIDSAVVKQIDKKIAPAREEFEDFPQPMCRIDSEGILIFANRELLTLLGFEETEYLINSLFDFITDEDIIKIKKELSTLKIGERISLSVRIKDKNQNQVALSLILEASKVSESRFTSFNCFFTKLHPVQELSNRITYQSLLTAAKDGMAVGFDEMIISANDTFAKIFGYETAKELEQKNILELVSEENVSIVRQYLKLKRTATQTRESPEFLARKKDGSTFYAEFYSFELEENQQLYLILIAKDISERKRILEAAKDSEQKYKNITENIDDLLYTFERFDSKILPTYFSTAIEKITGYTQSEFLSDQRLFLKIIHPDDFHDMKKRLAFHLKSDVQATSEFEFRILNKSGNVVWVRNKINAVRDPDGKILKIYGLVSDITFNKRAEEELKQSAANLKKLNDAKDRFLSIISHDLRAPFSSILGFTDLLLEDETLTDVEKQQYITYIQDSSKSMLALVNSMLDWTRLQTGRIKFEPEKLNAREIIESSISTVSGIALKKGVEIENLVEPSLHIYVDKNLILHVFNNLLSNAVKFTKLGDRIMISVNASPVMRFITFSVKDTGIGIKEGNLEKLFSIETKFTSEGTAGEKGSGLGLSLVKDIVAKHGGHIEVKSEFGKGTEFIFTLPIASTKILLVDHNTKERMFYSKVLINITTDYAINVVSNGREALERIIQSPPALVITEHKMPIMSGLILVRELIKNGLKDTIPVIVLTSDIDRAAIQEYTDLGIEFIFNKPINLISLKEAIEKSLKKRNT
jgi:two-component system, sensor histidine kinase and response regulator